MPGLLRTSIIPEKLVTVGFLWALWIRRAGDGSWRWEGEDMIEYRTDGFDIRDEEWGVFLSECVICHKQIAIVGLIHAVDYGYIELNPHDDMICSSCCGTEHPTAVDRVGQPE